MSDIDYLNTITEQARLIAELSESLRFTKLALVDAYNEIARLKSENE